jgi:hypothetical protein
MCEISMDSRDFIDAVRRPFPSTGRKDASSSLRYFGGDFFAIQNGRDEKDGK